MINKYTLKDIIDYWDPLMLLPYAPNDEYNDIIEKIYNILKKKLTVEELAVEIQKICKETIGEELFDAQYEDCFKIAMQILKQSDLIRKSIEVFSEFEEKGVKQGDLHVFSVSETLDILDLLLKKSCAVLTLQSFGKDFKPILGKSFNMHHGHSIPELRGFLEKFLNDDIYYRIVYECFNEV